MNGAAIFDDQWWRFWVFCASHNGPLSVRGDAMKSALTAFAIVVCGISLICFVLMTPAGRRGRQRNQRKTSSSSGGTGVIASPGSDSGGYFWSWFGFDSYGHSAGGDGWGGSDSGGDGGGDG